MPHPPPGCWACGAVPSPEDIRLGTVLHPREARDGGPFTRMDCPGCGTGGILEILPGGEALLAPPAAAGVDDPLLASLLEGAAGREARRRARAWIRRWGDSYAALRLLRQAVPAAEPEPPPPPPPPPRGREDRDPPPRRGSPRSPRPPEVPLPRNRAEAREILGLPRDAGRDAVDAAFRAAARKCHPDLVAHLDPDFQRLAHAKFLRLKRAHEILTA